MRHFRETGNTLSGHPYASCLFVVGSVVPVIITGEGQEMFQALRPPGRDLTPRQYIPLQQSAFLLAMIFRMSNTLQKS